MKKYKKPLKFSLIIVLLVNIILAGITSADTISPSGPTKTQTVTKPVTGTGPATPAIYWFQLDDGRFEADYGGGLKAYAALWNGDNANPYPVDSEISDTIDLINYAPSSMKDANFNPYPLSYLQNLKVVSASFTSATSYLGKNAPTTTGATTVSFSTITGHSYVDKNYTQFDLRLHTSYPKVSMKYDTPLNVNWSATIDETKTIDVTGLSALAVNDPQQFAAKVGTKNFGASTYSPSVDISNRAETTWTSSNPSVATVSSTGEVTGLLAGTSTIKATWSNGTYNLTDSMSISVTTGPTPTPTPTPTATPVGQTPVPTAAPTPTPPPTCDTPVTINASIPTSAKDGATFSVSASGSKDSTGGSNLAYQWYYMPSAGGVLVTGPSTRDATFSLTPIGSYTIYLGIVDKAKAICSAQMSGNISITPPKPDADVVVNGTLKINRPLVISTLNSSSPAAYPIVSRVITISPLNGATAADVVTLEALYGTTQVDTMIRKIGDYNVSNTVCNTLSLCDTKTIKITIADDLNPLGDIQGGSSFYRDPLHLNKANVSLTATLYSIDSDNIGSSSATIVFDKNNDGNYADDLGANSFPATLNLITSKLTFTASSVGKYLVILYGCETFDPGPFASYLTTADYKCTNPGATFTTIVNNQAPTTSLSAQKTYKTDIALNIGDISDSDRNYILNNITSWTATLRAKGMDAQITAVSWNKNFEPDYLKDTGSFLTTMNWRLNLDKKFLIGITNSTTNIMQGSPSIPLDLQPIPISSVPFEGRVISAKANGKNVYMVYQNPIGQTADYYINYASGPVGNISKQSLGYQYTSANNYPYNAYASLQLDTNNNPYIILNHDPSNYDNIFHQGYHLFYPIQGVWDQRMDTQPGANTEAQPTQQFSRMSNMKSGPSLWSTAGIFYINTWIQGQNYFRKPSNSWVPSTYPDYYTLPQQQMETYNVGYTVSNNEYWFGTNDYTQQYLFLNYNGAKTYFPLYNPVTDGLVSGNSVIVFSTKKADGALYKLTFTNGALVSETKLNVTQGTLLKINQNTGKLYMLNRNWDYTLNQNKDKISEFDYVNNTEVWTKSVPAAYGILDVTFDSDGVTPLYLFSSPLTNMVYLSKEGDMGSTTNDTLISKSGADTTASYNESGMYAWFTPESKGVITASTIELYKIHKVDPNGLYSDATVTKPYSTTLFGLKVLANNDIVVVGMDTTLGYFYALDSERYVKHYSKPYGFSSNISIYSSKVYMDVNDRITFTVIESILNGNIYGYSVNLVNKQIDYVGAIPYNKETVVGSVTTNNAPDQSSVSGGVKVINGQLHYVSLDSTYNSSTAQGTLTTSADGMNMGLTYSVSQSTHISFNDSSIDANSSNQIFAVSSFRQSSNITYAFVTNLPGFTQKSGYLSNLLSFYHVEVKFINDTGYLYGRRTASSNIEIYKIAAISGNLNLTFMGYIQNTNVFPTGWIGHSNYVYNGSYTNLPTAKTDAGISSYTIPTNFNGMDTFLGYAGSNLIYDNTTGGFSNFANDWSTGTDHKFGAFFDSTHNNYIKQEYSPAGGYAAITKAGYANGSYFFGRTQYSTYNGNNVINSVNMYKMDKNGTTNFYNFTVPDPTMSINNVAFTQDESGYTYGVIIASPYTNYLANVAYVITNKSGSFQTYTYSLGGYIGALSDLYVNHGKFMFGSAYSSYGSSKIFYVDAANLTTSSSFISKGMSTIPSSFKNLQYDPDSNNIFFEGMIYRGSNKTPQYATLIFNYNLADNVNYYINQFGYGDNFVIDKNNLFIADDIRIYKYNKFSLNLVDVGRKASAPAYGSSYFALNNRGKMIGLTLDGTNKGIVTVYNSIDISQTDPSLSTMIGGQTISSVFVGPQAIKPDVDYLVNLSGGQFMDRAPLANPQSILDSLTTYMDTNVKQQGANSTIYYILGDQLNLSGVYSDYESDPKQAEKYKLYHDPSGFDHNQGIIPNNGQNQITPLTLDHVGAYTGYYVAQDNPTFGNTALNPFSKWSNEDTPVKFVVHRRPFAVFNVVLRDDATDPNQVIFGIMEASYDLDHNITDTINKGIVKKEYMYKDASSGTWIDGLPPTILPKDVTYDMVLTVTDVEGATAKASTTFFTGNTIPNNLPVIQITNILSTDPSNPDVLRTLTPNYIWSYVDPDGDPQQKYTLNVYNVSNTIVSSSNEVVSSSKTYTQATNLAENVVYSVQVQGHDGFGYGALSPKKYFKIITNRPPTGNLTFTTPIYQHDTPSFSISQSDPDGDALSISVDASFNGGSYTNVANWHTVPSGISKNFTYGPLAQGSYTLKLTLDDGKAGVFTQTYSFIALPLTLSGAIRHTAIWESNRLQWNSKYPLNTRAANVFWAGEALELSATVTNTTTSSTKPLSVKTSLIQTVDTAILSSLDQINYLGEMVNTDFVHTQTDGVYIMRFQVDWSNGLTQTTDVPFQIKDNIFDVIVVQLRN